jgi:hypothetical protein
MGSTTIVRSEPAVCDPPEKARPAPEEVRRQLTRLLASPLFQHSKHYPALLRYIVNETLEGRGSHLKERALGVDVFSREPNYDTNADPVVRTTACEVRKRIAQYYHEFGDEDEIRIDLPAGAYVPDFRFPVAKSLSPEAPPTPPLPTLPSAPLPSPATQQPSNSRIAAFAFQPKRRNWVLIGAAVISLGAAGFLWSRPWTPDSALDRFWSPVVSSPMPVLMCISGVLNQEPPNSTPAFPSADATVRDMLRWNRVPFSDALALSSLTRFLGSRNRHTHVRLAASLKLEDLRDGPAVLIGAFNNRWTLRLARQMRFSFVNDGGVNFIQDRQNPSARKWRNENSLDIPLTSLSEDYALISRVVDPTTGQLVVTAAGIMAYGTRAAGEFLTDAAYMEQAVKFAPGDWTHKNIQIVLSTKIVGENNGPPRVEAAYVW